MGIAKKVAHPLFITQTQTTKEPSIVSLPSPEDTAREILAIFVGHFRCRPDHVLRINNFFAVWHNRGLAAEDLQPGMEFAVTQGWFEVQLGKSFKLTSAGFAEA